MSYIFLLIVITLIYLQSQFASVNGLKCYECTSKSTSSPCIINKGSISECNLKYCTIYRQEYVDPAGYLVNFYRSCEDKPKYLNTIVTTSQYKTYYHSCTTDLCNGGDGNNVDITSNIVNIMNKESSNIIIVPGMGSPASQLLSSNIIVLIEVLIVMFCKWFNN
ncbi:hypothetical protein PV327_010870 [Microctonus hyperodae]|uniref:Uncharacterized protein n=1 Tax=Microctonus hyperodae TaxID=165561 RepID=A0AA39F0F0_MICHY|nr:hypothetical protein PV327_010870 [Microctonus hyperodae]